MTEPLERIYPYSDTARPDGPACYFADSVDTALRALVQQWRERADALDKAAAETMDPCEYAARTGAATMARHCADALATLLGDTK